MRALVYLQHNGTHDLIMFLSRLLTAYIFKGKFFGTIIMGWWKREERARFVSLLLGLLCFASMGFVGAQSVGYPFVNQIESPLSYAVAASPTTRLVQLTGISSGSNTNPSLQIVVCFLSYLVLDFPSPFRQSSGIQNTAHSPILGFCRQRPLIPASFRPLF